jgi:hypothetical protein
MVAEPTFDELLRQCQRSAVHLEMRDGYMRSDPAFTDWLAGSTLDPAKQWPSWFDLVGGATSRGVQVRRARIVSEPASDYVHFEYDLTRGLNEAAGEAVRWLSRRSATDLALPGNDFWLFDGSRVLVNHFSGDGESAGQELTDDPAITKLCMNSFEAVWERAIPHADYLLR